MEEATEELGEAALAHCASETRRPWRQVQGVRHRQAAASYCSPEIILPSII